MKIKKKVKKFLSFLLFSLPEQHARRMRIIMSLLEWELECLNIFSYIIIVINTIDFPIKEKTFFSHSCFDDNLCGSFNGISIFFAKNFCTSIGF